jgi:hypothetical protein
VGTSCSGTPVGEGSAADLAGAGIPVAVTQNAATTLRAVAVGALGTRSACSSGLTYVNDVAPPDTTEVPPKLGILLGQTYTGTATDALTGVDRVLIRIDSLRAGTQTLTADLTCDALRRSCTWSKQLPTLTTVLATLQVTAIDRVGLRDPTPVVRRTTG